MTPDAWAWTVIAAPTLLTAWLVRANTKGVRR